jgi:starvation-inducible DNA-binding protein
MTSTYAPTLSRGIGATAVPGFIAAPAPALAASPQAVLVDLIELHPHPKQAHWNVVGHNFRDLHPQPGQDP